MILMKKLCVCVYVCEKAREPATCYAQLPQSTCAGAVITLLTPGQGEDERLLQAERSVGRKPSTHRHTHTRSHIHRQKHKGMHMRTRAQAHANTYIDVRIANISYTPVLLWRYCLSAQVEPA